MSIFTWINERILWRTSNRLPRIKDFPPRPDYSKTLKVIDECLKEMNGNDHVSDKEIDELVKNMDWDDFIGPTLTPEQETIRKYKKAAYYE